MAASVLSTAVHLHCLHRLRPGVTQKAVYSVKRNQSACGGRLLKKQGRVCVQQLVSTCSSSNSSVAERRVTAALNAWPLWRCS